MQKESLIRIGNGNFVIASRVVAILNPASSPMRRLVLDSNHVLLSSVGAETMSQRIFATKQDGAGQGFSEQQEEPAEKK